MLNIEYLKTLPSDELAQVLNRTVWCLYGVDCTNTTCKNCIEDWLQNQHTEYTDIKGVIKFNEDPLRKIFMEDGIESVDCEDCKWNVEAIRFAEFEDYIVKFKNDIEGSFVYKKDGKKYIAEIHEGNLAIKEYEVTWKDICIAMKNAGIKDNNIIRKVHDELNVY